MNINRNNYEELFLLYIDHELNPAARKAVEEFVRQNPDLGQELLLLQHSMLRPDHDIIFPGKQLLMHPSLQENFVDAGNATLNDDERLYRPAAVKAGMIRWLSMAAAVCGLIIAGSLWWMNQPGPKPVAAIAKKEIRLSVPDSRTVREDNSTALGTSIVLNRPDTNQTHPEKPFTVDNRSAKAARTAKNEEKIKELSPVRPNHQTLTASESKIIQKPAGEADDITGKPMLAISSIDLPEKSIAAIDPVSSNGGNMRLNNALDGLAEEVVPFGDKNDGNVILTSMAENNKTALRGLFRKASRFIDRTAALRASKKAGVHIGNIEIAIQ